MSTFRAQVRVADGMLHTSRPLTAPEQVSDMIESAVYSLREAAGGDITSVELTIETSGSSDTPIADSTAGTTSEPIGDTPIGDSVAPQPADVPGQLA